MKSLDNKSALNMEWNNIVFIKPYAIIGSPFHCESPYLTNLNRICKLTLV